MENSKDKEVIHERLEELGGSAMATQRSNMGRSRLHNFCFPTKGWGCQRILRCVKSVPEIDSSAPQSLNPNTKTEPQQEKNALYSLVNNSLPMSSQISRLRERKEPKNASSVASKEAPTETTIPWNLRKRRPSSDATTEKGKKHHCSSTPSKSLLGKDDPGKAVMQETTVKNDRRRKFSISLTRKEIEEDFIKITGKKPSRRPKKRPKAVQKQLDALFPGLWL